MFNKSFKPILLATVFMVGTTANAAQFVVEMAEPMTEDAVTAMGAMDISEVESLDTAEKTYVVLDAEDKATLDMFFDSNGIDPLKIKEVGFVNSPEVGGGEKAGAEPQPGHQSYVIERPVPGIGDLPLETQKQLSMGSNAALSQVGDGIEWVRSYLTDEGTYCVYRAVDTEKIVEHGKISEFPINTIAEIVPAGAAAQ